jgi:hypothetical protein
MFQRRAAHSNGKPWTAHEKSLLHQVAAGQLSKADAFGVLGKRHSNAGIRSKLRKVRIANDLFGDSYREAKSSFSCRIGERTTPRIVFEAYAGAGHQTICWIKHASRVFAAEKDASKVKRLRLNLRREGFKKGTRWKRGWEVFLNGRRKVFLFKGQAVDAAISLAYNGISPELVDLDTCGSTIPTVPLFLTLLRPTSIVITHGEFHSWRFGRTDVLARLLAHGGAETLTSDRTVFAKALEETLRMDALRAGNEISEGFWLERLDEQWLGSKARGMLRRCYTVSRPIAAADCLNQISL